jgi:hypothetical protein
MRFASLTILGLLISDSLVTQGGFVMRWLLDCAEKSNVEAFDLRDTNLRMPTPRSPTEM